MKRPEALKQVFGERPSFSVAEARRALRDASAAYVKSLLQKMEKQGRIFRITRGVYSFSNDTQVAGFAFPPFYYGLQDALSLHGIGEQETNPVVITARKVRTGLRAFSGSNYIVKRIPRKKFFGFETLQYGRFWVPVSTVEKTAIDLVYFRQTIQEDAWEELRSRLEKEKLEKMLARCSKHLAQRVRKRLFGKKSAPA